MRNLTLIFFSSLAAYIINSETFLLHFFLLLLPHSSNTSHEMMMMMMEGKSSLLAFEMVPFFRGRHQCSLTYLCLLWKESIWSIYADIRTKLLFLLRKVHQRENSRARQFKAVSSNWTEMQQHKGKSKMSIILLAIKCQKHSIVFVCVWKLNVQKILWNSHQISVSWPEKLPTQ